jgi:ATP synthase protein I
MAHEDSYESEDAEKLAQSDYPALTAAQAQALRDIEPAVSPWRIVRLQCMVGVLVALVAWGMTGKAVVGGSALYGALVVVIPAALFARGLMSRFSSINPATASFGFFLWEAVKIGVSVVMLAVAPRLIENLSWLALMAGLIVTLKVYWLALLMRAKPQKD